jgi:transcriptional regulator, AraC family
MKLCSSKACVVVLTESNTWLSINNSDPVKVPANHMIMAITEGNVIEFSALNRTLIAYIDKDTVKAYLRFIEKKLTSIPALPRHELPFIYQPCRTPDIFKQAARHSTMNTSDECEIERTRSLLFTVLSIFLNDPRFLPLLMRILSPSTSERVRCLIDSDIQKEWYLESVASCLFMSSSLLKKRLKSEETSYSQIITECRMHYAAEQLLSQHRNINTLSHQCGYHSPSHFISVFKAFYGMTPLNYISQQRQNHQQLPTVGL